MGRMPNFCEELLLRDATFSDGENSAPDTRTSSLSDEDMVNNLVFQVTIEIQKEDRDKELIFEI